MSLLRRAAMGAAIVSALTLALPTAAPADAATVDLPNAFLGLRTGPSTDVSAICRLGNASSIDQSVSVWVGVGGTAPLDIIQVGAIRRPNGTRFFAAYGRGYPTAPGSLYVETDLGPADGLSHAFAMTLRDGVWDLSVDGISRLAVRDDFRTWAARSSFVMHETEGAADEPGGTARRPVICGRARADGRESQWQFGGVGAKAIDVDRLAGADWFIAVRKVPPRTAASA